MTQTWPKGHELDLPGVMAYRGHMCNTNLVDEGRKSTFIQEATLTQSLQSPSIKFKYGLKSDQMSINRLLETLEKLFLAVKLQFVVWLFFFSGII